MSYKGRAFVKVKTLRDPGMHLAQGDKSATRKVLSHLKYIGFRSRELDFDKETKGLFDKNSEQASLKKFYSSIEKEPGLRHSSTVKIHKVIISLKQEDYEKYGRDFKDVAREMMKGLERRKGMELEWVGSVHLKEGHPHVHLAIKSIGRDFDDNSTTRLYLDKDDIKFMRDEVDRSTGRDFHYARDESIERSHLDLSVMKEFSKTMEKLTREGERETQRSKGKAERQAKREADKDRDERER